MPVYEFACKSCGQHFDKLSPLAWEGKTACPSCGSYNLVKQLSLTARTGSGHSGCGNCSGKNCGSCR